MSQYQFYYTNTAPEPSKAPQFDSSFDPYKHTFQILPSLLYGTAQWRSRQTQVHAYIWHAKNRLKCWDCGSFRRIIEFPFDAQSRRAQTCGICSFKREYTREYIYKWALQQAQGGDGVQIEAELPEAAIEPQPRRRCSDCGNQRVEAQFQSRSTCITCRKKSTRARAVRRTKKKVQKAQIDDAEAKMISEEEAWQYLQQWVKNSGEQELTGRQRAPLDSSDYWAEGMPPMCEGLCKEIDAWWPGWFHRFEGEQFKYP